MKKIGILYLCTGPYIVFWKDFFDSFEEKFCPGTEKHYYVFTDADVLYMEEECDRVEKIYLAAQPWPLVTLLRFHAFLSIEDRLNTNDYLMFFNANLNCNEMVCENEILPTGNKDLFFVQHPGYFDSPKFAYPYERKKKSTAYIPYNCGETYVIGAVFGGKTKAFLHMAKIIKSRIDADLKNNIIALWHDESQLNRYIVGKENYNLLSPSFCYPHGFEIPYERKIVSVSKQDKFDVRMFKYSNIEKEMPNKTLGKINNGTKILNKYLIIRWMYLRDCFLGRRIEVL